jgi:hypothetical protein
MKTDELMATTAMANRRESEAFSQDSAQYTWREQRTAWRVSGRKEVFEANVLTDC